MIEVIKEGDRIPIYYFLKCELCHSILKFLDYDVEMRSEWEKTDDGVLLGHYDKFLECPVCGTENSLSYFQDNWATSEEKLDKGEL